MFQELSLLPKWFKVDTLKAIFMASQGDGFKRTLTYTEWATGMWLAAKQVTEVMVELHPEGPEGYPGEVLHLLHLASYDLVDHLDRHNAIPIETPGPNPQERALLQDACHSLLAAVDRPGGPGKLKGDDVVQFCSALVKAMMGDRPLSEEQVNRGAVLLAQECQGALTPETAIGLVTGLVTERCLSLSGPRANAEFIRAVCEMLEEETVEIKFEKEGKDSSRPSVCSRCSNLFAADADYCRKCGALRPGGKAKTPSRSNQQASPLQLQAGRVGRHTGLLHSDVEAGALRWRR